MAGGVDWKLSSCCDRKREKGWNKQEHGGASSEWLIKWKCKRKPLDKPLPKFGIFN
jgi:hypothetical protein